MATASQLVRYILACRDQGLLHRAYDSLPMNEHGLTSFVEMRILSTNLPRRGERAAVTTTKMKSAALFFDRVWAPAFAKIPIEVAFFCGSDDEIAPVLLATMIDMSTAQNATAALQLYFEHIGVPPPSQGGPAPRFLSEMLRARHGIDATPVYDETGTAFAEFKAGDYSTLMPLVEGVGIAVEENLSWEQVLQIRRDAESKAALRRFRSWLDREMSGKPLTYVEDQIFIRLENYNWALKKHGVSTVNGLLSDVLDFKFLAPASAAAVLAAVTPAGPWAALAAGGIMLGKVCVSLSQRSLDLDDAVRTAGADIAFIHSVASRAGAGSLGRVA